MHRIRFAFGVGLLLGYEKYKTSRLSQKIVTKLIPSVFPSLALAAAAPKLIINNTTPCPPSGDGKSSNLSDTSKSAVDAQPQVKNDDEPLVKHECRPFVVAGNLKMFVTKADIDEIAKRLKKAKLDSKVEVVLIPPIVYLQYTKSVLPKSIKMAAPNCHHKGKGPYTGEVSPLMVKEVGADWVVLGQAERRTVFGEKYEIVGQKICRALHDGLKIMVCVGELIEERESGEKGDSAGPFAVLEKQLCTIACHVNEIEKWCDVVLVYEPIWSFGTGKTCQPEDAQAAHEFIRNWLEENVGPEVAESTRIIYGGAVTNAKEALLYAREDDVDGFFVGYPSVKPDFIDIVNVIKDTNKEIEEKKKVRARELKAASKKK